MYTRMLTKKIVVGVFVVLLALVDGTMSARLSPIVAGNEESSSSSSSSASSSSKTLSRVDQLTEELQINQRDPNQNIRTNVALNLEWGI